MAQAQIDALNKKKNVFTQTGDFEFFINLSSSKKLHFYYSKAYKDYVICLLFSNSKKYIISRDIWLNLVPFIPIIQYVFNQKSNI